MTYDNFPHHGGFGDGWHHPWARRRHHPSPWTQWGEDPNRPRPRRHPGPNAGPGGHRGGGRQWNSFADPNLAFPGGWGFGPGFGRRRAGRGDVRAAVLALLAEEPRHGYALIAEVAQRSGGRWRPSPGSVYPVLSLLEDEGLIAAEQADGKRVYRLTDAGRAYVDEHADELREPWGSADGGREDVAAMFQGVHALGSAAREVVHHGTPEQVQAAQRILDDARKALYRLLADDSDSEGPTDS